MRYLLLLLFCGLSNAAIIDVTESNTDPTDGNCDLYSAIESANTDTSVGGCTAGNGSDTIRLTINVAFDRLLPVITGDLSIESNSTSKRFVEPLNSMNTRIFETAPGSSLSITNLALRGGDSVGQPGGCIYSEGDLTINSSLINYCSGSDGGGVYANSNLTINSSSFNGNAASFEGSAIYSVSGTTNINNSAITNGTTGYSAVFSIGTTQVEISNSNIHGNFGVGVSNSNSTQSRPNILINQSSITSNQSYGVYCSFANCSIINSTVANNSNVGLYYSSSMVFGGLTVDNSTIYNNGSGNIRTSGGSSTIRNTALGSSFSPAAQNCGGSMNGSDNVSDDPSCSSINATVVSNLGLGGITYNNQTRYYVPQTGSPLIAAGNPSVCANSAVKDRDQIFAGRPQPANTNCEVGSIEVNQGTGGGTTPNISLIKTGVFDDQSGDGYAQAGETITYSFTVTNTGTQTLTNVSISDPLVTVTGSVASLAPSAVSNAFSATYTITQNDIDNGVVNNTATVTGTGDDTNVTDTDSHSEPLSEPPTVPAISLVKTGSFNDVSGDGFAQVGETITYSFVVENTGTQTLNNVYIDDPLVTVNGSIGTMPPGAVDNSTFSAVYTLTQADIDNAQVDNTATVTGTGDDNDVTDTDSHSEPLATQSDIELTKSGVFVDETGDGFAQVGETINYTFVVENTGEDTLYNVTISDPLITVHGMIPSLAPGAVDSTTFTGVYGLNAADLSALQVDNIATVTGTSNANGQVSDISNNNVPFVVTYDVRNEITLIKSGVFDDQSGDGFAQVGETITYTFVAENVGSQDLYNAFISDPIIANVTPSPHPDTLYARAVDIIFDDGFDDANDSIVTFTGTYSITQTDIDNGFVSNIAQVDATTGDDNVSAESNEGVPLIIDITGTAPDIELLKFGVFDDNSGDGYAQAGETVSYSFTVTNTGAVTLTNVTVSDPLFTVSGSVPSMAPGAVDSSTFSGTYTLTQADVDLGQVSNIATVTGFDPGNVAVTDQSNSGQPLITPLPFANSINLVKTGVFDDNSGDGFAQPGETITYSFVVENTGNQTLSNVTISDPLVTVTGSVATLAPGAVDNSTFSAVYTLTQADIDNGQVDNTAIVNALDPQNNNVSDSDNHSEPLPVDNGIVLIKTGSFNDDDGDGFAQVGETITYGFSVENTSSQTLSNITITDPLITVNGSLATMMPGAIDNSTFSGTYTLTQADIDAGEVINTATVTGTTPQNDTVSDDDTHTEPLPIFRPVVQVPVNSPFALIILGLLMVGIMRRKLAL